GDLEVVVGAGGGESAWYDVFSYTGDGLVPVQVDGAPAGALFASFSHDGTDWTTGYDDGFIDHRFAEQGTTTAPAPLELRDWVLEGTTLTRSATGEPGCLVSRAKTFEIVRGSC
ncbi:hypothetical protein, partial [Nocardioides sp.]|uniref:hypothetical protein n=1 Tax=Nocardioides sp. TaxID=35761 RepID=UPI002B26FA2E